MDLLEGLKKSLNVTNCVLVFERPDAELPALIKAIGDAGLNDR
jgi:hypothetical protein